MLDYSGCVLYNWALLDEKGPVDMNNARMLRRFTGEKRCPRSSRRRVDGVDGDRRERLVRAVDATRRRPQV